MSEDTRSRFRAELTSFFLHVLLNMAFGALAMAFGMQYIVTLVL
jgi:lipopolysaccharide export LptBFGC system permease protein LptF